MFREVNRLLKPGAPFVVVFSNRMFPTKAVAIWRTLNDQQHFDLIATYFQEAEIMSMWKPRTIPPALAYTDPVYVVIARKGAAEQ